MQSEEDPDYLMRDEDILEWEAVHGTIGQGTIVLIHTGRANLYANRYTHLTICCTLCTVCLDSK